MRDKDWERMIEVAMVKMSTGDLNKEQRVEFYIRFWVVMVFVLSTCLATVAAAHGNDDHEHSAPMATSVAVAPRASAQTDEFELVAVLQAKHLVIYLDRFDSNMAVTGAVIEIDSQGKWKAIAKETEPGVYLVDLPKGVLESTGKYPLTFSVQTEDSSDVLAASLEIADEEEMHDHDSPNIVWWKWLVAVFSGLGVVVALLVTARRRSSTLRIDDVSKLSGGAK